MVTALVMLQNIRTVFHLAVLENNFVIKGNVYEITQCFTLLSTGKQEKNLTQFLKIHTPSRIRFFKKVPEKQKINFSWPYS